MEYGKGAGAVLALPVPCDTLVFSPQSLYVTL